jgi:hypothetical protein
LHRAAIQIKFHGALLIGQVPSHELEAQHPAFQRLVVPSEDGASQVIEAFCARLTLITLSGRLVFIETSFDDSLGITKWTLSAFWPAQLAHSVVTLGRIYQVLYVYLHRLDSYRGLEKVGP